MYNQYSTFKFLLKKFINFAFAFFCFTIIGTVSHEFGHIIVAKNLGYCTTLHFGSMNFDYEKDSKKLESYALTKGKRNKNKSEKEKNQYHKFIKEYSTNYLLIDIGGPLQTIITGTIGLIFLLKRRKKITVFGMKFIDWVLVFLTLFWLREVFNLAVGVLGVWFIGNKNYFGGDEKNIADRLHLFSGAIAIPLAVIGLIISLIVIFKIIPKQYRFTFIVSGFVGGILGFLFWYKLLGPIVLS